MAIEAPELDDFGLPVRKYTPAEQAERDTEVATQTAAAAAAAAATASTTEDVSSGKPNTAASSWVAGTDIDADNETKTRTKADIQEEPVAAVTPTAANPTSGSTSEDAATAAATESDGDEDFKDAVSAPQSDAVSRVDSEGGEDDDAPAPAIPTSLAVANPRETSNDAPTHTEPQIQPQLQESSPPFEDRGKPDEQPAKMDDQAISLSAAMDEPRQASGHTRDTSTTSITGGTAMGASEFSHQQLTLHPLEKSPETDDGGWQQMPAYAPYDIYDDDNKLIAKEHTEAEVVEETYGYGGLGGAGKGYTKVLLDDDAESVTSMDDNTNYLFKDKGPTTSVTEEEETQRDAVSQLQATKELLTEGQRIAYVGLTRLELSTMLTEVEAIGHSRKTKKQGSVASESMKMWGQKMMIRLYTHMDISPAEQVMIEQLSSHGVMPQDLTPVLMANARVKNPMADNDDDDKRSSTSGVKSPRPSSSFSLSSEPEQVAEPPPPYAVEDDTELSAPVRTPSQMPTTQKIDIDLRWTVLCDLFLVLIADSIYDARSRVLLERVGKDLEIPWIDICRFEKKVTDALEMQQNAEKENWNEAEHMENRRKINLRRRYVMMGLATVGGGLVIGLSAGLLAPVIGAGLAAGFTTIGVTGTSGFLAGAGGAAIITSSAAASGSIIGVRAAERRTGSVKTFEYRPLHNNKRVNLIVTVSGWMTGKVDDVRLPYSTVDPIMGDIYSVLWEPEMLTSMGDTINILATEALTQGLQQILGNTILVGLMAALQLPVVLTKLSYLIDNPWAVSLDRATMAGKILADSLIDRNLGTRPVTLVGYSLGSRVIFSCLQELAKKGAYGLVQNVLVFGSPVVVKQDEYLRARTVVAGRFVNGYNRNDWILGYLFRLTNGGIRRVAGLAAIEGIEGLENMDVSEFVVGHMDYRTAMPRLLRECGWSVESDEFTEIEDPDPEKHQERQRELINEIEEARKELEKEGKGEKKGVFSIFKKKKALPKQEWEVYEDSHKNGATGAKTEDKEGNNHGVLFDVDAIRAELAKDTQTKDGSIDEELFQVREIKSTLPPMKLDLSPSQPPPARTSREGARESKSAEAVPQWSPNEHYKAPQHQRQPSYEYRLSSERTPTFPLSNAGEPKPEKSGYHQYSSHNNGGGGGGLFRADDHDDEIQMTFDTAFEEDHKYQQQNQLPPPPLPSKDINTHKNNNSSVTSFSSNKQSPPAPPYTAPQPTTTTTRPEIRSAQTVQNITLANAWADDDDDDDFGKEKEISMAFA
ncbi:hypothetical protein B0T22DRAFT_437011 [Podospora appendiculata]|uniref:Uncharacterized protein n=1 Tax=Podospora appendiculata TaxID=314037 RepID=A0AAE1CGL7_9PEZI|nr:hypothetical protein B0T22DRAFT_437011 [Podospora appendiculata]